MESPAHPECQACYLVQSPGWGVADHGSLQRRTCLYVQFTVMTLSKHCSTGTEADTECRDPPLASSGIWWYGSAVRSSGAASKHCSHSCRVLMQCRLLCR